MKKQLNIFNKTQDKEEADSALPALNVTQEGAEAWNLARDLFVNLKKVPSHESRQQTKVFLEQLVTACRYEAPSFDAKELVNFLCYGVGNINSFQVIPEVYAYDMHCRINSVNRHEWDASPDDLELVKNTVEGLEILKKGLSDEILKHEKGEKLISGINYQVKIGREFLEKAPPQLKA